MKSEIITGIFDNDIFKNENATLFKVTRIFKIETLSTHLGTKVVYRLFFYILYSIIINILVILNKFQNFQNKKFLNMKQKSIRMWISLIVLWHLKIRNGFTNLRKIYKFNTYFLIKMKYLNLCSFSGFKLLSNKHICCHHSKQ